MEWTLYLPAYVCAFVSEFCIQKQKVRITHDYICRKLLTIKSGYMHLEIFFLEKFIKMAKNYSVTGIKNTV
jgi:hypothetical protein